MVDRQTSHSRQPWSEQTRLAAFARREQRREASDKTRTHASSISFETPRACWGDKAGKVKPVRGLRNIIYFCSIFDFRSTESGSDAVYIYFYMYVYIYIYMVPHPPVPRLCPVQVRRLVPDVCCVPWSLRLWESKFSFTMAPNASKFSIYCIFVSQEFLQNHRMCWKSW